MRMGDWVTSRTTLDMIVQLIRLVLASEDGSGEIGVRGL